MKAVMYMRVGNYDQLDDITPKKVAYVRVANKDKNATLNQIEYIKAYTKSINVQLDDIYVDDGYSSVSNDRPSFKKLMREVAHGNIDTIFIKNFTRLSRDVGRLVEYTENYFPKHNVNLYSIDDGGINIKDVH